YNHADCRLMSKRALDALADYKEVNLFLRGMVTHMGFKNDIVYFERAERFAGESKYPLKKMLNFAWDGITSFSTKPLRFISVLGGALMIIGVISLVLLLILSLIGSIADWWMPTMNMLMYAISIVIGGMTFLSGAVILCMGVVGEYVGKIYAETKARPRYAVDVFLNR
ncbi:MAG: glycosyltransferase, partial [Clostridia bacterium]|nr:glycosyltransferase [Clostridia bacterium]